MNKKAKIKLPTAEMIRCANAVAMVTVRKEQVEQIVRGYEKRILEKMQAPIACEWVEKGVPREIILDPKGAFLMEEAAFQEYIEACHRERDAAGLKVAKPDHCPLCEAEALLNRAERDLLEALAKVPGLELFGKANLVHGEMRKQIIDKTLRACAGQLSIEAGLPAVAALLSRHPNYMQVMGLELGVAA